MNPVSLAVAALFFEVGHAVFAEGPGYWRARVGIPDLDEDASDGHSDRPPLDSLRVTPERAKHILDTQVEQRVVQRA